MLSTLILFLSNFVENFYLIFNELDFYTLIFDRFASNKEIMLYLNTHKLLAKSVTPELKNGSKELISRLIENYKREKLPVFLNEENRALVFDFYMQFNEEVFQSKSKALVYDYLTHLEEAYGHFLDTIDGEKLLTILGAIDHIWQEVQAPVSELVNAGKQQLKEFNGAATYANFQRNTADKPELFAPTKKLVDHYLNNELMSVVIEYHLNGALNIADCATCLKQLKNELQEFAVMARQFGFWNPPKDSENQVIRNIVMLDILAAC